MREAGCPPFSRNELLYCVPCVVSLHSEVLQYNQVFTFLELWTQTYLRKDFPGGLLRGAAIGIVITMKKTAGS